MTLSITMICHYAEGGYADSHDSLVVLLNVITLNIIIVSVILLSFVILSVVMF